MKSYKILHNLTAKIIALILASFIWGYFHLALTEIQTYQTVAIELKPNENQIITQITKNSLTIILKGPRESLAKITNKDFIIRKILPTQINPGLQQINVKINEIQFIRKIPNISVESVIGEVECYADNVINKVIKVQPSYESFLANYYTIEAKINDPKIKIKGPSLVLKDLHALKTELITIEAYNILDFEKSASIEKIKNISLVEQHKVTISFKISETKTIVNLNDITIFPIFLGQQNSLITSKIPNIEVTLTIPPNLAKQLNPQEDFKLFIEIPQSPLSKDTYKIKFMTPIDGLKLKEVFPSKIEVSTKKL